MPCAIVTVHAQACYTYHMQVMVDVSTCNRITMGMYILKCMELARLVACTMYIVHYYVSYNIMAPKYYYAHKLENERDGAWQWTSHRTCTCTLSESYLA